MKRGRFFAAVMMWVLVSSISFGYSGGDGSSGNPYQIADANDLLELSADTGNYDKCFVLTGDIDLAGRTFTTAIIAPDTSSSSNFQGTKFSGVFDGNRHIISNLTIAASANSYIGLFGYITLGGIIRNLGVINVDIDGSYFVGGLLGFNSSGTLTSCYSTGSIIGSSKVGGLAGYTEGTGGFNQCYSRGTVSGTSYVGGLVGANGSMVIINCYSTSDVIGSSFVGGLIGDNGYQVSNSYSTGAVSGTSNVGGLIGSNGPRGRITNCFWDTESSGRTTSAGGTGKTTAEMKTLSTFTSAGWDFATVWAICESTNYPRLIWQIPAGDVACPDGVGTEDLSALSSCWLETVQAKSDVNDDNKVDFEDVLRLSQNWLMAGCGGCNGADISGDGSVNELDLIPLAEQWLMIENAGCQMMDLNADGGVDLGDWAVFAGHWLEGI